MSEQIDKAKAGIIAEHQTSGRRHRFARGPDRIAHGPHQPPHRAPPRAQEGSPQPAGAAHAGRSTPSTARLHQEERRRALPGDHRQARTSSLVRPPGRPAGRPVACPAVHRVVGRRRPRGSSGQLSVADCSVPRGIGRLPTGSWLCRTIRGTVPRSKEENHGRGHFRIPPDLGHRADAHVQHRPARPAVAGRGRRLHRRHPFAGHRQRRIQDPGRHRLLPAHHRRRGEGIRRGQDPRLVLPPRGSTHRCRRAHLPAHRPPAASQLRQGLPQRDPGRGDGHRRRPGEPVRRRRDQRRLRRADDLGAALRGPDRRRAPGVQRGRHLDPAPDLPGRRGLHLPDRRRRPRRRTTTSPS